VPVDGEVLTGESSIDESMLTGESLPSGKGTGAPVYAGTLNQQGMLRCRATSVGSRTALAAIVRLVEEAQGSRAPIQRLADRISGIFVPVVVGVSLLTFAGWMLAGGGWSEALVNAVAVLVIACPCALGLATPTAIMVGSGRGARAGVLVRNAAALELAGRMNTLVVDKTGTLTAGRPEVTDVVAADGGDTTVVIAAAAALEHGSEHPLARAIQREAERLGLTVPAIDDFKSVAGKGVTARVAGDVAWLGSPAYLHEQGHEVDTQAVERLAAQGKTVVAVAAQGRTLGLVALADRLRPSSADAVARLRALGIDVVMLTGDNAATAREIAREAGIATHVAQVLPADKAAEVNRLRDAGRTVGMVGDGVNDASALAAADVSFAIGAGTDVAIRTADITLMKSDLLGVVNAVSLSRATLAKVRQNLFFAFVYNVLGIPLAALGMLNPVVAGAAMALSSVSVVSNSLLLRRWRAPA